MSSTLSALLGLCASLARADRDLLFSTVPDPPGGSSGSWPFTNGFGGSDGVTNAEVEQYGATDSLGLPALTVYACTSASGCVASTKYVSIDQNWLWYTTDITGTSANTCDVTSGTSGCPDSDCSQCTLAQPASYSDTYGITTSGDALTLPFVHNSVLGSRVYLTDGNTASSSYTTFKMLNQEISFDVEMTQMGCGFNGALYFVEMAPDGDMSTGAQGPAYGTGYCDAQCPSDAHTKPDGTANAGLTQHVCCNEMDLWEANQAATAFTAHPCQTSAGDAIVGPYECSGDGCDSLTTSGVCDGSGCDFNSYRLGDTELYGSGYYPVDSSQKMTVTTQFHAPSGVLQSIVQLYTVNGNIVKKNEVALNSVGSFSNITDDYCTAENDAFAGLGTFAQHGGLTAMGASLDRGMAIVLSIWNASDSMVWLDGVDGSGAGSVRGPCTQDTSLDPTVAAAASVTYSSIKYGDLDTTYDPASTGSPYLMLE